MTVSNQVAKVVVSGNGAQLTFAYSFLIPADGDFALVYTDATGVNTTIDPSQYSVAGLGNPDGGTFSYPLNGGAAIAAGTTLTLVRQDQYTQDTSFASQNNYNPTVLEMTLDGIILGQQQLAEQIGRCIQVPVNELYMPTLPSAALRANLYLGFDPNGVVAVLAGSGSGGGGGSIFPISAPLLATNSAGQPIPVTLGPGMTITSGVLTIQVAAPPPNAPLLGTDFQSNLVAVPLGIGLASVAGTLTCTAAVVPVNAPLLSSNSGGTLTAIALGAGLLSSGGTISTVGASLPPNAPLIGSDSGSNPIAIQLGNGLQSVSGTLRVFIPYSASILGSNEHAQLTTRQLGAGFSIVGADGIGNGGTITLSTGAPPVSAPLLGTDSGGILRPVVAGAGVTIAGGVISAAASAPPTNAPLLGSVAGTLVPIALGAGLSEAGGTLTATGGGGGGALPPSAGLLATNSGGTATAVVVGAGLSETGGTLSVIAAAIVPNAALLASNSGGTPTAVTLGAGLAETGGTLSVTTATPPVSAPLLGSNSGGTLTPVVVGVGLVEAGGTLSAPGSAIPAAGIVLSTGSAFTDLVIGGGLSLAGGTLTATSATIPAAGIVLSTGSALTDLAIGANLTLAGGTLSAAGSALTVTDGTHTVASTGTLNVIGGTVGGSAGTATLTVTGGGGGGGPVRLGDPTLGVSMIGRTGFRRPPLSSMTQIRSTVGTLLSQGGTGITNGTCQDFNSGSDAVGPLVVESYSNDDAARGPVIAHGKTGAFTITGLITQNWQNRDPSSGHYCSSGIVLYETISGLAVMLGFNNGLGNPNRICFYQVDTSGGLTEYANLNNTRAGTGGPMWFRLSYSLAGAITAGFSIDGLTMVDANMGSMTGFFTGVPDCMGIMHYNGNVYGSAGITCWHLY
jgi:hypothetical protein